MQVGFAPVGRGMVAERRCVGGTCGWLTWSAALFFCSATTAFLSTLSFRSGSMPGGAAVQ